MSKVSSPSSAGGTVAGAGGVGGSVGTSVGLTTARQKGETCTELKVTYDTVVDEGALVQKKSEGSRSMGDVILHVFSFTLTPGPSRLGVWAYTVAL